MGKIEQSLSPEAFRKLHRFVALLDDREDPSMEDHGRWDAFWYQAYSDGSLVDNRDLGEWLMGQGLTESHAFQVDREDVCGPSDDPPKFMALITMMTIKEAASRIEAEQTPVLCLGYL